MNPDASKSGENISKSHLHTTIPEETKSLLEKLALRYGNISKVLEKAVEILAIYDQIPVITTKRDLDDANIWHLMRSELNMVAVGRTAFLSYIFEMPKKAIMENNAVEIIEWFFNYQPLSELSLLDVLGAIQKIWMSANYFRRMKIDQVSKNQYRVVVGHDFNQIKYSTFWATYFKVFFEEKMQLQVEVQVRPQLFHLNLLKSTTKSAKECA